MMPIISFSRWRRKEQSVISAWDRGSNPGKNFVYCSLVVLFFITCGGISAHVDSGSDRSGMSTSEKDGYTMEDALPGNPVQKWCIVRAVLGLILRGVTLFTGGDGTPFYTAELFIWMIMRSESKMDDQYEKNKITWWWIVSSLSNRFLPLTLQNNE